MYLKKGAGESGELEATWTDFSLPRSYQPAIWKVLQVEQFQSTKGQHGAKLSHEEKSTVAWVGPHVAQEVQNSFRPVVLTGSGTTPGAILGVFNYHNGIW